MRTIHTNEIKTNIKEMCIEANYVLSQDVAKRIYEASESEENENGKKILNQLIENMDIAKKEMIPICQDTGMTTVFIEVGQDVHFEGDFLENAINEGIKEGYEEGYLRKSVVKDPIERENTKDNTPGIIHYSIVKEIGRAHV